MANAHLDPGPAHVDELRSLQARLGSLEQRVARSAAEDRMALVVFSGSFDRLLAAFVLASTGGASGMQVEMFFTFWALAALRDARKRARKQDLVARMFGWMLPKGMGRLSLSQMNMLGAGPAMMRGIMKKKNLASLDEMLAMCAEFEVKIWACDMSARIMGIERAELIDYPHLDCCGAATFLERASKSKVSLFI